MPTNYSERIVICNWNYRGDRIIKELHSPQAVPDCPIVVLSEKKIETNQYYKLQYYQNVTFIYGDPMDKKVLEFVNAHQAKSIIILADDDAQDPDAKSVLIALAVSKLYEKKEKEHEGLQRPHISAESKNHRKIEHLKDAGVNEVVCSSDYGLGLLAQSAIVKNISVIFDDLLRYSDDSNEVYVMAKNDIPNGIWMDGFAGKSFAQTGIYVFQNRQGDNPVMLIGVIRDDEIFINPKEKDAFDVFKDDDQAIFIAYERPEFK